MLNLTEMAEELKEHTAWQETPVDLTDSQYLGMVLRGLKRLFIDTGRAREYNPMKLITTEDDFYCYDQDFLIDEEYYIMLTSQIEFFKKVQTDVNNTFGYTTNALSVTNADKPYANLQNTLGELESERRIVYYKMVRFTLGEGMTENG